jgi:hypothetical protein
MAPPDDIPLDPPAGETEGGEPPKDGPPRRKVGPESEVRGGPEAADQSLDETDRRDQGAQRTRR